MMLHELKPAAGSNKAAKRKGRGHGSGNGKTAGYGHKGQKARSGAKKAGFEGGQLPLQRRLPKVGFNNSVFATNYAIINVCDLEERFEANSVVDEAAVVASGLVKKVNDGIKVLGRGEITKPLTVELKAFSASAKAKIEAAGGKAEVK
ncbi:MAG: 50S ribosomal protein L15 [Oscillospiraceae bacterium]|nr:50S ribosomal protein L15 [Oscillospiraceae bacterium]